MTSVCSLSVPLRASMRQARAGVRAVQDFVRARSPSGTHARVPLRNGTSFGAVQSRGDRLHQEDTYSVSCVQLPCEQLRQDVGRCTRPDDAARAPWNSWSCEQAGGERHGYREERRGREGGSAIACAALPFCAGQHGERRGMLRYVPARGV